jgi:hypothetical protein
VEGVENMNGARALGRLILALSTSVFLFAGCLDSDADGFMPIRLDVPLHQGKQTCIESAGDQNSECRRERNEISSSLPPLETSLELAQQLQRQHFEVDQRTCFPHEEDPILQTCRLAATRNFSHGEQRATANITPREGNAAVVQLDMFRVDD